MPLIISEESKPLYKNKFILTLEWMHGDADGDTETVHQFSKSEKNLVEQYYKLYNDLIDLDREDNSSVPKKIRKHPLIMKKFLEMTGGVDSDSEIEDNFDEFMDFPSDITSDHQFRASLRKVDLKFFNEEGQVHSVKVSK